MRAIELRTMLIGTVGAVGLIVTLGCGLAAAEVAKRPETAQEKQGYSLGHAIGTQLKDALVDVDAAAVERGFGDAIRTRESALDADQMAASIAAFEISRAEAAKAATAELAAANAAAGDAYRAQFALEQGVVALDSGLLYKVIEPGVGDPPEAGSSVKVHYRGSLVDGTAIDDSYSQGEPITVALDQALPGWTAALERMPEGAKWQVVIPPSLAYGETGAMGFVEPNTTLVFELERVAS